MHFVIMGCGRVGALLGTRLDEDGHSVAIIDSNPEAFRRLRPDFSGHRVTGVGFDRDSLRQAGVKDAYAFAAVSGGDNSNIIAARVVRETFGISRVVARIFDPSRADLYQRLGIPTVASTRITGEAIMRHLMPPDLDRLWTDATGSASLCSVMPHPSWDGVSFARVEELAAVRIAFVSRIGSVRAATEGLVVQEHDELIVAADDADVERVRATLTQPPRLEL